MRMHPSTSMRLFKDLAGACAQRRACVRAVWRRTGHGSGWLAGLLCLLAAQALPAQTAQPKPSGAEVPQLLASDVGAAADSGSVQGQPASPPSTAAIGAPKAAPLPGDWGPELLYGIASSSNTSAQEALYDAAFATGPSLIPELQAALKDDRTAEFAAQVLAFLGGEKAMEILGALVRDPRDLDLRRFYLGALGEYTNPDITRLLLRAVEKSNLEPDRTVTQAAIWALTVRSDPTLVPAIRKAEIGIEDPVLRDELDSAGNVIEERAQYLASPEGKVAGGSVQEALHTYFIAGLEQDAPSHARAAKARPAKAAEPAQTRIELERVVLTPDQSRALAHVRFVQSGSSANYDIVLQKLSKLVLARKTLSGCDRYRALARYFDHCSNVAVVHWLFKPHGAEGFYCFRYLHCRCWYRHTS